MKTVADIMRRDFVSLKKTDSLSKAIDIFLKNPDMVFPVVDDNGHVMGQVSQHDFLKLALPKKSYDEERILGPGGIRNALEKSATTVWDLTKTHEIKIKPDMSVEGAARLMMDTGVLTLEVVDKSGKSVGFVSELDILKNLKKERCKKPKRK